MRQGIECSDVVTLREFAERIRPFVHLSRDQFAPHVLQHGRKFVQKHTAQGYTLKQACEILQAIIDSIKNGEI